MGTLYQWRHVKVKLSPLILSPEWGCGDEGKETNYAVTINFVIKFLNGT